MRKPIVAANWKMNGTLQSSEALVFELTELVGDPKQKLNLNELDIVLCPAAIFIPKVADLIKASNLKLGGQNCHWLSDGAYTGEISPAMLRDFSCGYVIIGHSERRQGFQESDEVIGQKVKAALDFGLKPILCVGETAAEREQAATFEVIARQLATVLDKIEISAFAGAVVAYEPVWAIGTGVTATSQQAQEVHAFVRDVIVKRSVAVAEKVRIIYGGSVKSSNARELFSQADIDGGLIGGASLVAKDFFEICKQV